jgi:hypothetical protein
MYVPLPYLIPKLQSKINTKKTSNYDCYTATLFNFPGQACVSTISSLVTSVLSLSASLTASASTPVITATFHSHAEAVNGYGVSIRFQASNTSAPRTKSTAKSKTTSVVQQTLTTTSPTSKPSKAAGGLSTGAKAEIGASVGAVEFIALQVLGYFLIRRRKRRMTTPPRAYGAEMEGQGALAKPQELYTPPAELR